MSGAWLGSELEWIVTHMTVPRAGSSLLVDACGGADHCGG